MVLYFSPQGHEQGSSDWLIYMGKDKFENEDLIKYGWPEDVWFHVDNMSSAHVYLRLPKGKTLDDIPPEVLDDCCQLVKQNSIQGCKENNVDIVYTMWKNLKKTASMEVGQVGFHKQKEVRKFRVEKKKNDTINRLNKSKTEEFPDLAKQREAHDRELTEDKKREIVAKKAQEKKEAEAKRREAELLSYDRLQDKEAMESNKELASKYASVEDYEDDFM